MAVKTSMSVNPPPRFVSTLGRIMLLDFDRPRDHIDGKAETPLFLVHHGDLSSAGSPAGEKQDLEEARLGGSSVKGRRPLETHSLRGGIDLCIPPRGAGARSPALLRRFKRPDRQSVGMKVKDRHVWGIVGDRLTPGVPQQGGNFPHARLCMHSTQGFCQIGNNEGRYQTDQKKDDDQFEEGKPEWSIPPLHHRYFSS